MVGAAWRAAISEILLHGRSMAGKGYRVKWISETVKLLDNRPTCCTPVSVLDEELQISERPFLASRRNPITAFL
jgi:hypothetical protein